MENVVKSEIGTVNIPIDEYFYLKQRAEMNGILMERLGFLEGKILDYDRRIFELEQKAVMNK